MAISIPRQYINFTKKSKASLIGSRRDDFSVFYRGMTEVPLDIYELVRDLIVQGSILNGDEHLPRVKRMIDLKGRFDDLSSGQKRNWCWVESADKTIARFNGDLIGVLCNDLAQGEDLNKAITAWNKRVDPANYKKAVAPITEAQKKLAEKFVVENGYVESFDRRFATLDDIYAEEILHMNVDGKPADVSIFAGVKTQKTSRSKSQFKDVKEISINGFMEKVLPTATSVEAYLENRMEGNMCSITTSNVVDSKPIFKYSNNFSVTFNGGLAGKSQLAEAVLAKGGRIDGAFRFTHSWNELEPNQSLMDLHVFMPGNNHRPDGKHDNYGSGRRVGWNKRTDRNSGGNQDVDYTNAAPNGYVPVENITFPSINKMPEGKYICKIHNWNFRKTGGRGKAEIAFGNECFQYIYPKTTHKEWVSVATVTLKNGKFTIEHHLPEINASRKIYNLDTNEWHKVNLVSTSPNHWGDNEVGTKQYLFMLDGAKPNTPIRSFHNVDLISDLMPHRKVMDVLGNTLKIDPPTDQKSLSGLGFNSTVKDSLLVKVGGSHKRMLKIIF